MTGRPYLLPSCMWRGFGRVKGMGVPTLSCELTLEVDAFFGSEVTRELFRPGQ